MPMTDRKASTSATLTRSAGFYFICLSFSPLVGLLAGETPRAPGWSQTGLTGGLLILLKLGSLNTFKVSQTCREKNRWLRLLFNICFAIRVTYEQHQLSYTGCKHSSLGGWGGGSKTTACLTNRPPKPLALLRPDVVLSIRVKNVRRKANKTTRTTTSTCSLVSSQSPAVTPPTK